MRSRIFFLSFATAFLYLALVFNVYNLQVVKGDYYSSRVAAQHRLAGFLAPERGNIYFSDKNGNSIPAAITKPFPLVFAVPKEIRNPQEAADSLSKIVGIDRDKLIVMLSKPKSEYALLLRKASRQQVEQIQSLKILGVYVDEERLRFYPFQGLASQLLGFVGAGIDRPTPNGRYGLELYYDDELSGQEGRLNNGQLVNPARGEDLHLTIDRNIQARGEEILEGLIKKFEAEKGLFIVQEPSTGKILAIGGYPNFDPNSYKDYALKDFLNPNLQGIYEPGSVMKLITMSAGIDSGKITPETTFYDSGSLTLNSKTIKNFDDKTYGKVTMAQVIENSINTGSAFAERTMGNDIFYNYLVKFGFGQKTGVALPGEVNGSIFNLKSSFREINFATASFGQGISVTPLQMINAVSAIANGGSLMKPYLTADEKPTLIRRVISNDSAKKMANMMVSAVKKNVLASIPKFDVAGKSGTAQIPDPKTGGYSNDVINTYIGFAPAANPRFTVLMRIDKPKGAALAGLTVVSGFKELSEFLLGYYNIAPDQL